MDTTKERVTEHGKEIDSLKDRCARHTEQIKDIHNLIDKLHG